MPGNSNPAQPVTAWEEFHGLTAPPFSLTPDLRFVYHSRSHSRAIEQVTSALRRREGLIVVTGEIGTGKTMLCRTLLETFNEARTFLSVILDPGLTATDLLYQVLADFGLIAPAAKTGEPPAPVTRHQLVATLQQFLASLIPLNAHAVIMIDEAQHLSPGVLEEIRLLSNFETDQAKLLQIVLVGQPNLEEVLGRPEMRQLHQRIARRCELQPLSSTEVLDYIDRRLLVAAGASLPRAALPDGSNAAPLVEFTPPAVRALAAISKGVPRIVNTLCDRSLEIAFERQTHAINRRIVREAARRLKVPVPGFAPRFGASRTAAAAAVLALAVALGLYWWSRPPARRANEAAQTDGTTVTSPAQGRPARSTDAPSGSPAAPPAAAPVEPPPAPEIPAGDRKAGGYEIAVAAFRTERRASEVSASLVARGLPVSTRSMAAGMWYQVVVGPFATSAAAEDAQRTLAREGFGETRVSPVTPNLELGIRN